MKIKYDETKRETLSAVVAAFDLEGFSDFCKHPDNLPKVPKVISLMFGLLSTHLGDCFAVAGINDGQMFLGPDFVKFTGDGAVLLWHLQDDDSFPTQIVLGMRHFQKAYENESPNWEREMRVSGLPRRLRVGIASGEVYPLFEESPVFIPNSTPVDYVGYCINLAFRLQDHFPQLGFMVQRRLNPTLEGVEEVKAIHVKGCHTEEVLVFDSDLNRVLRSNREECFKKLDGPMMF